MADPIIEPQDDSYTRIMAQHQSAQDEFFQQASDAFETPTSQPQAKPDVSKPKTPETDFKSPSSGAPVSNAHPDESKASKVPGPPTPAQPSAKEPEPAAKPEADDPLAPRDYKPGQIKQNNWAHLHSLRDQERERANKLEAELNTLRQQPKNGEPPPELAQELDTLRKNNEDLQARLESIAVERSPRFEAQFKPRQEAAIQMAKAAVGPQKAQEIENLLSMPDSPYRNQALDAIANELTGINAGRFSNAIAEVDRISMEKQAAASRSRETYQQWQSESQRLEAQKKEEQTKLVSKEFESELSEWQKSVDLLKPKGDSAHDAEVERRIQTAKNLFKGEGGLSYKDFARAAMWVSIAPDLASQNAQLSQQVQTLESELQKVRGAQPGRGADAGTAAPDPDDMPENLSYMDAVAHSIRKAGLPMG